MDPARCEDANITTELYRNVTPNSNGTPAELHFVLFFFNFCWAFSLQSMSSDIYFFLSHPWGCFLDLENCLVLNARTVKFLISWTRSELNHSERIYQLMLTIRQRFRSADFTGHAVSISNGKPSTRFPFFPFTICKRRCLSFPYLSSSSLLSVFSC